MATQHIHKYLKFTTHCKVAVAIEPNSTVMLKTPKFATLKSIGGSVKPLAQPVNKREIEDIIANDIARECR